MASPREERDCENNHSIKTRDSLHFRKQQLEAYEKTFSAGLFGSDFPMYAKKTKTLWAEKMKRESADVNLKEKIDHDYQNLLNSLSKEVNLKMERYYVQEENKYSGIDNLSAKLASLKKQHHLTKSKITETEAETTRLKHKMNDLNRSRVADFFLFQKSSY